MMEDIEYGMVGILSKSRSYYEELAESADLYDNILLTEDHNCPSDILDRYHDDLHYRIRFNVACNKNTLKETLIKMYNYGDYNITTLIIGNIICPLDILERASFNRPTHVPHCPACPENLKTAIKSYLWLYKRN